jgi:hypothetical protein
VDAKARAEQVLKKVKARRISTSAQKEMKEGARALQTDKSAPDTVARRSNWRDRGGVRQGTQSLSVVSSSQAVGFAKNESAEEIRKLTRQIWACGNGFEVANTAAPKELILNAAVKAKRFLALGALYGVGGVWQLSSGLQGLFTSAELFGVSCAFAPGVMVLMVICGTIAYTGARIASEGVEALEEPLIRVILNDIMKRSMEAYVNEDYKQFLEVLAEDWSAIVFSQACNPDLHKSPLITLVKHTAKGEQGSDYISIDVSPDHIIVELLKHEFRPDGIAWILCVLCDVLSGEKVSFRDRSPLELRESARVYMKHVLNSTRLKCEAEELDKSVVERRRKLDKNAIDRRRCPNPLEDIADIIWKVVTLQIFEDERIPAEYIKDAQEAPSQARLNEVLVIIKINLILSRLLELNEESIKEAEAILRKLRAEVPQEFQLFTNTQCRMNALEDLLFIISDVRFDDEPVGGTSRLLLVQPGESTIVAEAAALERIALRHCKSL